MSFFNQKQETMDVQLTQFGKNLLSRGSFKPVYYQFFDDDILYDAEHAGIIETQNEAETRILKETPRLKTRHLTFSVQERYMTEQAEIEEGELPRFQELKKNMIPDMQERILLYPMASQELQKQNLAKFDILFLESQIKEVKELSMSEKGIQKNIPIIKTEPTYKLTEIRENLNNSQEQITKEDFADILSDEILFSDNSRLKTISENLVLDIEELNCFTGHGNFYLNIYEVSKDDATEEKILIKLDTPEKISKYFNIKTDKDIEKYNITDPESKNYYKRGKN